MLAKVLGQIAVDKLSPIVVLTLDELLGDSQLQEEPAPLPTSSLPSRLLVLLLEVSDLGILEGLIPSVASPTSSLPPLLFLDPITILPVVDTLPMVQLLILEAGLLNHPLLVRIPSVAELSGLPVTMVARTGLLSSALPLPLLTLSTITVDYIVEQLMKRAMVIVGKGKMVAPVAPLPLAELA